MKRLIALLVAYGAQPQNNNDIQEEVFEEITEDIVFIVLFSINPKFELHLDDAGYIMDFHCLNEDAKKAFENINVAFQDKDGNSVEKYNHLNAVRKFCEKYAPELLPVAKEKKVAPTERLKNW